MCSIFLFFTLSHSAHALDAVGKVVFVKGEAFVERTSPPEKKPLGFNDAVFAMDTLATSTGELKVMLTDESILSLGKNSKLLITEYIYSPKDSKRKSIFDVIKGTVRTIFTKTSQALKTNDISIQTPTAVAGIRGTDVGTTVHGNSTSFSCFEGSFEAYYKGAPQNTVILNVGDFTKINNAPPSPPAPIPPSVQQEFETQLSPPSVSDVASQPGGENLSGATQEQQPPPLAGSQPPPPPGDGSNTSGTGANDSPVPPSPGTNPAGPQQGPPPPPPPPPLIPGGGTQTPPTAGPGGTPPTTTPTGQAQLPLTFPTGAQ